MDGGLRRTVIAQIDARLPALIADDGAWEEYSGNKTVMKALHAHQCETREYSNSCAAVTVTVTPPVTPPKNDRKFRA
jgi:histone acetyltransferase HTATIP